MRWNCMTSWECALEDMHDLFPVRDANMVSRCCTCFVSDVFYIMTGRVEQLQNSASYETGSNIWRTSRSVMYMGTSCG